MKYIVVNVLLVSMLILSSCNKLDPSRIKYRDYIFELPSRVKFGKRALNLSYEYYVGFYQGDANEPFIKTQLKGYPMFMGSDNDKEESYDDDYFVGVTFFEEDFSLEEIKEQLKEQYQKKFITKNRKVPMGRTLPSLEDYYDYFRTDQGGFIVIKEIIRKTNDKKCVAITFYNGISVDEIEDYLAFIF